MNEPLSRRRFLQSSAAVSAAFLGLHRLTNSIAFAAALENSFGYGPLEADPQAVIDLPAGFTYRVISRQGMEMDDGLVVPGLHDGAAAFAGPDGLTILITNHEVNPMLYRRGPFGWNLEKLGDTPKEKIYDLGHGKFPGLGGCTTTVYDTRSGKVHKRYMSLIGTERNCAGGPTPWNSWMSCEETVSKAGEIAEVDHGYCFEVQASAEIKPADPIPLMDMGRFNHEAIAVDPNTGIVYLTEDRQDATFYRFIPNAPGRLAEGGRLQALVVRDRRTCDTRNWLSKMDAQEASKYAGATDFTKINPDEVSDGEIPIGQPMPVAWIDVENVTAPDDDLRMQTQSRGAARFARTEGIWWGRQSVYIACTTGGRNRSGQIWRYVPSRFEGQMDADEARYPGRIELFLEPNDTDILENGDNLTVAPWGDLIVCEDSKQENNLVGVTPEGQTYRFAHNALSNSEFAGACFSPDGSTLFVNIQGNGITLAITGPWTT
jgi:secreted PhoX family phosphatase